MRGKKFPTAMRRVAESACACARTHACTCAEREGEREGEAGRESQWGGRKRERAGQGARRANSITLSQMCARTRACEQTHHGGRWFRARAGRTHGSSRLWSTHLARTRKGEALPLGARCRKRPQPCQKVQRWRWQRPIAHQFRRAGQPMRVRASLKPRAAPCARNIPQHQPVCIVCRSASSSLPLCDPRRRPSMVWHRPSAIADAAVRSLRTRTGRRVSGGAGAGPVRERCPLFAAANPLSAAPMHASTRTQAHARTHMHTCAAAQAHPPRAGLGRPGACPPRHAYSRRGPARGRST